MKAVLIGLGVILLAGLGLLFIAPGLVPSETYKTRIEAELSGSLGRTVTIDGDVGLSTFPVIRARAGQARIANPDGFSRDTMASMEGLDARIRLWPLLSRRVEIASFTLIRPDIALERRADGEANWEFAQDEVDDAPAQGGPFRRDGRYTDFDPRLDRLRIEDGRIAYSDAVADRTHELTDVDITLAMPGLREALDIEGSLVADGEPVTLDIAMDSPGAFLDGDVATLAGRLTAAGVSVDFDGTIPAGEALAYAGRLDAELATPERIQRWLPEPVPALDLLSSASLSGQLTYDGADQAVSMSDMTLEAKGDSLSAQFQGNAGFADTFDAGGSYSLDVRNPLAMGRAVAKMQPELDLSGLEQISSLKSDGTVRVSGPDVTLSDMTAEVDGEALSGTIQGSAGWVAQTLSADAAYDVTLADAGPTLRAFVPDLTPDADVLGEVTLAGRAATSGDVVTLTDLTARTQSPLVQSEFSGDVTLAEDGPVVDGTLSAIVADAAQLNQAITADIPYADVVGQIEVASAVEGSAGSLSLSDLTAGLSGGALNGAFSGRATVNDTPSLDGTLEVSGPSLRAITARTGTDLPPSTDNGAVFEAFALSGKVSGPADNIQLTGATVRLDEIEAAGMFGVDLQGERPQLTGTLEAGTIDLRPYMAAYSAQRPEGTVQAWSDAPIPTDGLRAADARLSLSADRIQLPVLRLDDARGEVVLRDGMLIAEMPQLNLYGGNGNATFVLDGRQGAPMIDMTARLERLDAEPFLSALSGVTQVSGTALTQVRLTGSGISQAAIMRSLDGEGSFRVQDGALSGIDAQEFLSGLQQALTARALPGGIGADEITRFQALAGGFAMEDGVATLNSFTLTSPQVIVEGGGQVDLGAQTVDIRLRPKAVGEQAQGLAAFGIPLRISGPFGSAKAGLDSEFLGQVVRARAAQEAQRVIGDRIGGEAGGLIGSILGAPSQPSQEAPPERNDVPGGEPEPEPEEPLSPEEQIQNGLLELFGGRKRD